LTAVSERTRFHADKLLFPCSSFLCCDLFALDNASAVRFGRLIDGHGKTWTNAVVLSEWQVEKLLTSTPQSCDASH